jgi:hypothetical protein
VPGQQPPAVEALAQLQQQPCHHQSKNHHQYCWSTTLPTMPGTVQLLLFEHSDPGVNFHCQDVLSCCYHLCLCLAKMCHCCHCHPRRLQLTHHFALCTRSANPVDGAQQSQPTFLVPVMVAAAAGCAKPVGVPPGLHRGPEIVLIVPCHSLNLCRRWMLKHCPAGLTPSPALDILGAPPAGCTIMLCFSGYFFLLWVSVV